MPEFTFIHAADIHLDSPLKGLDQYEGVPADEIRLATRRALENLVQLAIDRQVDFLLIAGDLYDGDWRDHGTGLFFHAQMKRLDECSIPVILIRGNHDAANVMTRSLRLPDNVQMLPHDRPGTATSERLDELQVAVHGQSFAKKAVTTNLVQAYPPATPGKFNIGLLHTSLTGAEGHESYAPCMIQDLLNLDYDYWALGHVHSREMVRDDPPIVFPGNIQGRHIRETDARGCYLVSVDNRGRCECRFEPLDVFRWERCEIDVSGIDRSEALLERFETELSRLTDKHARYPLGVRVVIAGQTDCHQQFVSRQEHWLNELRAIALGAASEVWLERVVWRTTMSDQRRSTDMAEAIEVVDRYLDSVREDETQLVELARELAPLFSKLPNELKTDAEPLRNDNPDQLGAWLEDVRSILIDQLSEGGAA